MPVQTDLSRLARALRLILSAGQLASRLTGLLLTFGLGCLTTGVFLGQQQLTQDL
jgi:hypothetical protein